MATASKTTLGAVVLLFGSLLSLAGCGRREACVLQSDCARDQVCYAGACAPACDDAFDCAVGLGCVSGACVVEVDAARPRPCDPDAETCASDGGAGDASATDARASDAGADGTPGDAVATDTGATDGGATDSGGIDGTPTDGAPTDGAPTDGAPRGDSDLTPLAIDLTGAWAVTQTVELSSDPEFSEGDVTNFIATLARDGGPDRYTLVFIDTRGQRLETVVALDFRAPNGPLDYQFEYTRPQAAPMGCTATVQTFQRGQVGHVADPPLQLDGREERRLVFEGDACAEPPTTVVSTVQWVQIPVPSPGDAGPPSDAEPASDAGPVGDAGPPMPAPDAR